MALACLAFLPLSSRSEEVFETTPNLGTSWNLQNVLPAQTGLRVSGIAYRYSVNKNTQDDFLVSVEQNNVAGARVFTFTDNWSGLPQNTITRGYPLDLDGSVLARGGITTQGQGSTFGEVVTFTYQYDPCLTEPTLGCDNYVPPPPPAPQVSVDAPSYETSTLRKDDEEERDRQALMKERKERARKAGNAAVATAQAQLQAANFFALDIVPVSYYASLPGGTLQDSFLPVTTISDNRQGRRVGFAQQLLHEEMVKAQYEEK